MSKSFLFKFLFTSIFLAAAVLYLLQVLEVIDFFNLSWAIMMVSGAAGALYLIRGLFAKNTGIIKKTNIFIGAALLIIMVFSMVNAILLPDKLFLPIVAIILTAALVLCSIAVKGKKWDQGDNQNVGYKNYNQRKASQEKQEQKEAKKAEKKG